MPAFTVRSTITVKAPIAEVYALVRDFKKWPDWSPWLVMEPDCKLTFDEDGRGYAWDGTVVGAGRIDVTDEREPERIAHKLTFLRPWKSTANVGFAFAERDDGVEVTWSMDSALPWFMFWMTKSMTAYVRMDFERGLRMLKDLAETGAVPSALTFPGTNQAKGFHYVAIRRTCSFSEVGDRITADLRKIGAWLHEKDIPSANKGFSLYHRFDPGKGQVEYTTGFAVKRPPQTPASFTAGSWPALKTYAVQHKGAYHHVGNAWAAAMARARAKTFRQIKAFPPFEIYENDPQTTPAEERLCTVHFPCK